jgi:hypothetical protein
MGIIVEIDEKQAERLRALTHQEDLSAALGRLVQMLEELEEGRRTSWTASASPSCSSGALPRL